MQFIACVDAVQEVDSQGWPKETGNGYRSETCAVMPSKFWWYATPLKLEYDVQSVDDTLISMSVKSTWCVVDGRTHRNVTKNGQQDVDEEISVAAALKEDT
jgi:hypothetical protein